MRLLFVADGRSPIALNWISYFVQAGHEAHLASTYPCSPALALASLTVIPAAFGELAGQGDAVRASGAKNRAAGMRTVLRNLAPVGLRTAARQWLGVLTLPGAARKLRALIDRLQPDLIHALRIPYEGMLAAQALDAAPTRLILSVWGNDFTLHARATPWMAVLTRQALQRAAGLHTDCQRDQHLARAWGFASSKPGIVLPGNGGIDTTLFYPAPIPPTGEFQPTVINPRGMRSYVRNDTFFRAIPQVLERQPRARFICPAMAGESLAERWMHALDIAQAVTLLPRQPRPLMAELFRRAQVVVSLTEHDGTPNTLLEALACGCYPVAGDIEALREWITPGLNGALAHPGDPAAVARAILHALEQPAVRRVAAAHNIRLIAERAEFGACMQQAEAFYRKLV